ncbi:Endothelin-converting enzyme 2 [Escovopsis weberi]|uniref:Endothelin-converting enzyme 2 n=1 Tax=Escovopsis weberi TaxID=150374 RepID=A0A0M8N4V8_ESCWE|nr:Endothelin-converting enzyme 2 [Escovopsis weberi]
MLLSTLAPLTLRLLAVAAVARCAPSDDNDDGDHVDRKTEGGEENEGDPPCECFLINGTVPTYYNHHMFYDFRSLSEFARVPPNIENSSDASGAGASSAYFSHPNWTDIWDIQTWDNSDGPGKPYVNGGTVYMVNTNNNVFISPNEDEGAVSDTYLTLRTSRLKGYQSASEFQTVAGNYQFASMRMLARTLGGAGAVTGMFTYRDETGQLADVQESDIEILTRGPRDKIQYTNQPSYTDDGRDIPQATTNSTTPDWSDWVTHRLDWTPKEVVWYVNGMTVSRIRFQTPKQASDLHFSAWSDGGVWSGVMDMGHEAFQHIQWIEVLYNTTDEDVLKGSGGGGGGPGLHKRSRKKKKKCNVVCTVDGPQEEEPARPSAMAESDRNLSRAEYWDERYSKADGEAPTHEWFRSFADLEGFFDAKLFRAPGRAPSDAPAILHLGCGDSVIPAELHARGYTSQLCVDFSSAVIGLMTERYASLPGIRWQQADVRAMPSVPARSVDVAFDKGTLDAMIYGSPWDPPAETRDNTRRYLREAHRVLRDDGVFLYITFRQTHFIRPLLDIDGLWDLEVEVLSGKGAFDYFGWVLRKKAA